MRMVLFFTLIFPVILYLFYGYPARPTTLVIFLNFAIQSAMLQTVGVFASVQKNSLWGNYVSTLPAPKIYPALGIIIPLFIVGFVGISLIGLTDTLFFHSLSFSDVVFAMCGAAAGALPMGALGYLIGYKLDLVSARNALVTINLLFLSMTFLPKNIQKILAWFALPNVWIEFSKCLVFEHEFYVYGFFVFFIYFLIVVLFINKFNVSGKS
jgi:hypothetical protein